MSSTTVFVFGIISLSISALATRRISKRRASAKAARHHTRPLILPWLVSGDSDARQKAHLHMGNCPVIIDLPSKPNHEIGHSEPAKPFGSLASDPPIYPSNFDHPKIALSSPDGRTSLPDNLHVKPPIETCRWAGRSPSPNDFNFEEPSLPKDVFPKRLFFSSLATSNPNDSHPVHAIYPKCHILDRRDSMFSNRDSITSISSSVQSQGRDSLFGADEFQKLEFVIGSGHRLQAQYGILSSPGSNFQVPASTPIRSVHQFD